MAHDFVIGCVGKPSAGKSTFFNAVTEAANAKVGSYPFTTIDPNQGVAFYTTQCPCKRFNVKCKPKYARCVDGKRYIPVKMLDIAGLIPGASVGRGLGNKFLDDLRHANILIHIIDISGTTNEKGEATVGYDPCNDHDWLVEEIELWIFNNLWNRWSSISRKHKVTQSTFVNTFLAQLSGYGAKESLIRELFLKLNINDPVDLSSWSKENLRDLVKNFVDIRFKFTLVLNKADSEGNTDQNALKVSQKYPTTPISLSSALAECFLRKMSAQKYIIYESGDMFFKSSEDFGNECSSLKSLDFKLQTRLNKIKDMVLYRYGSTGVNLAINMAVDTIGMLPVYPVRNLNYYGNSMQPGEAFPDCILVKKGTSIKGVAKIFLNEDTSELLYAEGVDGRRIAEHEIVTKDNNIFRFILKRAFK